MKRLFLALCALSLSSAAMAQLSVFGNKADQSVDAYALPRTVIEVSVEQEREVIIRGPYARYASQYLGVTGAPMVDKESYKILSASLSWTTEADPNEVFALDGKKDNIEKAFRWITPQSSAVEELPADNDYDKAQIQGRTPFKDMGTSTTVDNGSSLPFQRASAVEKSEEQMAADAAEVIFKIRKRRLELICGEQGEHVYGEGLKAALKEMDKIEKQYVSLFLGKRYTQKTTRVFRVTPAKNAARIVAFRFTENGGLAAADDLAANPINLEFTPVKSEENNVNAHSKGKFVKYRLPEFNTVKLWDGITTFDSEVMPIYQKGKVVDTPIVAL